MPLDCKTRNSKGNPKIDTPHSGFVVAGSAFQSGAFKHPVKRADVFYSSGHASSEMSVGRMEER